MPSGSRHDFHAQQVAWQKNPPTYLEQGSTRWNHVYYQLLSSALILTNQGFQSQMKKIAEWVAGWKRTRPTT